MEKSLNDDFISLNELLIKLTYQTQITHPSDLKCSNPISWGSGFVFFYKEKHFFITADHTVHLDDYEVNRRTGIDYVVSIINNVSPKEDFLSTVVTPLGGFYYTDQFNISKPEMSSELIDLAVCQMKDENFEYPFLTDSVIINDVKIPAGEVKIFFTEELMNEPNEKNTYCIYGKINNKIKNIFLTNESTLKFNIKFINKFKDYYLFYNPTIIADQNDWRSLSGSPVFCEQDGTCVGVLCSVNENSHSIWVMPFDKIKMVMDISISLESLNS